MWETTNALVVVAPIPGVMADDVVVTLEDGELHLDADLRTPASKDYMLHEWHYGPFERTVHVGAEFGEPILLAFGNGQLTVSLSRRTGSEPLSHLQRGAVRIGGFDGPVVQRGEDAPDQA
jgi:HSP20 family molecular chaperone IbpA